MSAKLTIASVIFATSALSANVQAQEISLQDFVSQMVHTAVSVTQKEVRQNVQQAVANTSYSVFNDPRSSVSITDLTADNSNSEQDKSADKQAE